MRVIAGSLGGRTFKAPSGHKTHPMSDKIRGAVFNALGELDGLQVLDAFAGSGALGFEAISRGAAHVLAIEPDRNAQQAIAVNSKELAIEDRFKLIRATAGSWLSTTDDYFDIVLCDPPYDKVQDELLVDLAARVELGGVVVMSLPPDSEFRLLEPFTLLTKKEYGDAVLYFYRRNP